MVGCFGSDPWPEPDPGAADTEDNESQDSSPSTDASNGGGDTNFEGAAPDQSLIYCSAPTNSNMVTVAGLTNSIARGDTVIVESLSSSEEFTVYTDGSFAGRINAQAGEILTITARANEALSESIEVAAGEIIQQIDNGIMGNGQVSAPDNEGQVAIEGYGELLAAGHMVIGANINQSTSRDTLISCSPTCHFDLFISGQANEEIDLFIVETGQTSSQSNTQTVTVP